MQRCSLESSCNIAIESIGEPWVVYIKISIMKTSKDGKKSKEKCLKKSLYQSFFSINISKGSCLSIITNAVKYMCIYTRIYSFMLYVHVSSFSYI